MADKMQLTDRSTTVAFSPLVNPAFARPDSRTRGSFQASDKTRQFWDTGGAYRGNLGLNDISQADADQLNQWWRDLAILDFSDGIETAVFANLNGTSQYFYRTDADFPESGITGANDLTIQAWIKPAATSLQTVISKYVTAGDKRMYWFYHSSGRMFLAISSDGLGGHTQGQSNIVIVQNVWQHIVVVYDASAGTADFYYNGAFVNQTSGLPTSIVDEDPDLEVGRLSSLSVFFGGGIADVALFDDKRTAAEILSDSKDFHAVISDANLIGQWLFSEGPSASFIDNTQGDAGRDLIPNDGGDTTFGNCGRDASTVIHSRISPAGQKPIQMDFDTGHQNRYAGTIAIVETSSSSSSSG